MAADVRLMTAEGFLKHWQGHRGLTRRAIEGFPDDQLFTFSVGGMRTFGELASEMLGMAVPTVKGISTGVWTPFAGGKATTKAELLSRWDEATEGVNEIFPKITQAQFDATHKAFGQWEMSGLTLLQYVVENEVHHRGQGYVYLRALGIEPPAFWDR